MIACCHGATRCNNVSMAMSINVIVESDAVSHRVSRTGDCFPADKQQLLRQLAQGDCTTLQLAEIATSFFQHFYGAVHHEPSANTQLCWSN